MNNILKMLERRNYFDIKITDNNIIANKTKNEKIIIFNSIFSKLVVLNLKETLNLVQKNFNDIYHIILIYEIITPTALEMIKIINQKKVKSNNKNINSFIECFSNFSYEIEIFPNYFFSFDIISHFLQPNIKILSSEETINFWNKLGKNTSIPFIKTIDPIVKYFNLKLGTIIEFEKDNKINYRIVKNEDSIETKQKIVLSDDKESIISDTENTFTEDITENEEEIIEDYD